MSGRGGAQRTPRPVKRDNKEKEVPKLSTKRGVVHNTNTLVIKSLLGLVGRKKIKTPSDSDLATNARRERHFRDYFLNRGIQPPPPSTHATNFPSEQLLWAFSTDKLNPPGHGNPLVSPGSADVLFVYSVKRDERNHESVALPAIVVAVFWNGSYRTVRWQAQGTGNPQYYIEESYTDEDGNFSGHTQLWGDFVPMGQNAGGAAAMATGYSSPPRSPSRLTQRNTGSQGSQGAGPNSPVRAPGSPTFSQMMRELDSDHEKMDFGTKRIKLNIKRLTQDLKRLAKC